MADVRKTDFSESGAILEEEDAVTLAAIDRAVKSADEGRLIPLEEVRRRISKWPTKSSLPKTR